MTMFVRPVRAEDSDNFVKWATRYFDPKNPVQTLCVYKHNKIIAYLPIEDVFVSTQFLDSLVINPEASNLEIAEGMRELIKHTVLLGYLKDAQYIYFIGDTPETNKVAERIFEKVEFPVYRVKLRDLENG